MLLIILQFLHIKGALITRYHWHNFHGTKFTIFMTCMMYRHRLWIRAGWQHGYMSASSVGQWWWHIIVFSVCIHFMSTKSFVYQHWKESIIVERKLQVNRCYNKIQLQLISIVATCFIWTVKPLSEIHLWSDLPKPATYACNVKEWFSLWINSSVNKLIATTPLTKCWLVYGLLFLRLVSEACYVFTSASGIHWMPLVGLYR